MSSVPAFGRRMGEPAFTSSEIKVYPSNSAKLWRVGALGIGLGLLLGFLPLRAVLHWLSGGPMPSSDMFTAATCLLFIPARASFCSRCPARLAAPDGHAARHQGRSSLRHKVGELGQPRTVRAQDRPCGPAQQTGAKRFRAGHRISRQRALAAHEDLHPDRPFPGTDCRARCGAQCSARRPSASMRPRPSRPQRRRNRPLASPSSNCLGLHSPC